MTSFAQRCGVHDAAREAACAGLLREVRERRLQFVRVGWCDMHGMLRGKTLLASALADALADGVGMVGTLLLKDTSDRTTFKVFEPGIHAQLPGFAGAANLLMLPDPSTLQVLPWAEGTGWLQAQPWFADARPVEIDTRRVLQRALARLAQTGYGLRCGLEVEFHIYRIDDARLDPMQAAWPGEPPTVSMVHPGYQLLGEGCADLADEPLRIVAATARGLGLPLRSLEIELGPSQVEAVFDATDALTAADQMVLFRNGVKQALRRAGYHASFVCKPPFPNVMASGWHLHQSLVEAGSGTNAFCRDQPLPGSTPADALHTLSPVGARWLAGLLEHAPALAVFGTPTINGFGRFAPRALAPRSVLWGRDNRGAMLRVIGAAGETATRLENRVGEPLANPYLYIAAQIVAGLEGLKREALPPPATDDPYAPGARMLPNSLGAALDALAADDVANSAWDADFLRCFVAAKRQELARHDAAEDKLEWQRREYFSRY
jgi:glutamine synthetase